MAGEWHTKSLRDLVEVTHGFAFSGDFIQDEPCGDVLLTPGNFAVGGGFKSDKFKFFAGVVSREFVLQEGDLVVTMTDLSKQSDTLGYPAVIPESPDGRRFLHNQRLGKVLIKDSTDLDVRYLYYVLCGREYRNEVLAGATGTTVKHTSPERIRNFQFSCAPLTEQRAIAQILGTLDNKIELNRRMNETLEAMARALFKSWFVDFDPVRAKAEGRDPGLPKDVANLFSDSFEESELGEIPARWRLGPITELQADRRYACVAGPFGSNLSSRDYVATGVPVLRGSSLSDVSIWIRESGFVFVSDEKANSLMGCLAYPGDIVFTQRGTLGQVSIIPPDSKCSRFLLSQSQMKLAVQSTAAAFYVALYFRQRKIVEYITANGQQAGVPHINLGFLRGFRILLPPLEVLRAFDFVVGPLFRAARARGAESETLAALRDTLLPKLISGELRVKDVERFVEQTSV